MIALFTYLVVALLILAVVVPYWRKVRKRERTAARKLEELKISGLNKTVTVHPHIDALQCIGCGTCVDACPEGDVLGVIQGKAMIVHGSKCVGHGLCADACPVGAITLLLAAPGRSADLPILNERFETTVPNLYIAGELGGLGLIKNAVTQGRKAVDALATRRAAGAGVHDVAIVGAGPAGMAAALAAQQHKLKYLLFEQGSVGGTILQYPRHKIVLTSPVEIPLWGKLRFNEVSKEKLLEVWEEIIQKTGVEVRTEEKVTDIARTNGTFRLQTPKGEYASANLVLAMGRRGTPRKLGVPGEGLGKVTYRLMEAEAYQSCDVLIVGGGDSALEAAMGLAHQGTNRVTLSYRSEAFTRIKERNREHLQDYLQRKKLIVEFSSTVKEIRSDSVVMQTPRGEIHLKNDYVFVFIGGEMPYEFLKKAGVKFRNQAA